MKVNWKLGRMKEYATSKASSPLVWWVRQSEANSKIKKLQCERDVLAGALRQIDNARLNQFAGPHDMALNCVSIARKTLTSVKGGAA